MLTRNISIHPLITKVVNLNKKTLTLLCCYYTCL